LVIAHLSVVIARPGAAQGWKSMAKRKDRIRRWWERRVKSAERERRYAAFRPQPGGLLDAELVGWSDMLRPKRGQTGGPLMTFRPASRGEPPIPRDAHRPATGVDLARAYAYRFFRDRGERDGEARRLAACFELNGWKVDGPWTERYLRLRRRAKRSGVRWFSLLLKAVARLGGKRPAADERDRDEYLGDEALDERAKEIRRSFAEDTLPSWDLRTSREDGPAIQPWTPSGKDLPDDEDHDTAHAEFVKFIDHVAGKVNESIKEVGRGVPTPPVKFDGTHMLVLRDGVLVAEEIPLRGSEEECRTEAELHRFLRTLPPAPPCTKMCDGGNPHGHCANCTAAVPAFAYSHIGPHRAPRFYCSWKCWDAIWDAARAEEARADG
jgi:hypothetical protein